MSRSLHMPCSLDEIVMCSNDLCKSFIVDGMNETEKPIHETAKRLLEIGKASGAKDFTEIAKALGGSDQSATNWKTRGVPKEKIIEAAMLYKANVAYIKNGVLPQFLTYSKPQPLPSSNTQIQSQGGQSNQNVQAAPDVQNRIPLISWVQAGGWTEAVDIYEPGYAERWLPFLKTNGDRTFALRVVGDSMTARFGKTYPEGCIIFVDPENRTPENGDRIIAKLQGTHEVTFKVFTKDAGRCWLRPLNDSHPPIYEEFSVVGKVIGKWEDD